MSDVAAGSTLWKVNRQRSATDMVDDRMITLIRMILALSALLIVYAAPPQPARFQAGLYTTLVLYAAYSALIYAIARRRSSRFIETIRRWSYWIDTLCFAGIIAMSGGGASIFFMLYFFPILIASFRWGFNAGLRVTLISCGLYTVTSYVMASQEFELELNRLLLRPISLLLFGYMIAYWGGSEIKLKRRLALLKEVNKLPNPSFGIAQAIGVTLEQVRAFYDAESSLLIMEKEAPSSYSMYRASRRHTPPTSETEIVGTEFTLPLLSLPRTHAVVYQRAANRWWPRPPSCHIYDLETEEPVKNGREAAEAVADLLEAGAFVSVPMYDHEKIKGRFFLTARQRIFDSSDVDFLGQIAEQVRPVIENIWLAGRLASEAAERERQKISRDIHDSTLQPYIGLKLALEALRRGIDAHHPLASEIDELIAMSGDSITELRGYVRGLKDTAAAQETVFVPALRREAEKFSNFYDINVEVIAENDLSITERLAAEAFQIVREGLSNVRRHTEARRAVIQVRCCDNHLILLIENDGASGSEDAPSFIPRSITERALALGGSAQVVRQDGHTTVSVDIPV